MARQFKPRMGHFVMHDQAGRIHIATAGQAHRAQADARTMGLLVLEVDDLYSPDHFMVADGKVVARPASPITRRGLVLSGVPATPEAPADLMIGQDGYYQLTESRVELEFGVPGPHQVTIKCWPYKDWVRTIEHAENQL